MGAYGGKKEIMQEVSPLGKKITQAGTLSGNPLAMSAGLAQLKMLAAPGIYQQLGEIAQKLGDGIRKNLQRLGLKYAVNQIGAMMCIFFTESEVVDFSSASTADTERFKRYFWESLERGVYLAPSQFECMFPSLVHSDQDIEQTLRVQYESLKAIH